VFSVKDVAPFGVKDVVRAASFTPNTVLAALLRASDTQLSGDIKPHAVYHSLALLRMGKELDKELPETC
jgi:hypothetical protein